MKTGIIRSVRIRQRDLVPRPKSRPIYGLSQWARGLCCLVVVMAMPMTVVKSQIPEGNEAPRSATGIPPLNPLANRHPDANRILEDSMHSLENQRRLKELNVQRQKQMTDETAKLLALANQLKAETAKGSKDTVSIVEVRKAELIEKLAHDVREKMKATVTIN